MQCMVNNITLKKYLHRTYVPDTALDTWNSAGDSYILLLVHGYTQKNYFPMDQLTIEN